MRKLIFTLCILFFIGCSKQTIEEVPPQPVPIYEETPEPAPIVEPDPEPEPETPPPPPAAELPKENPVEKPSPVDPGQPMIALTFDDGPSTNTKRILDILSANNCHATFFVPGYQLVKFDNTAKAIIEQGSEIGGHSWSHSQFTELTGGQIWLEIDDTNNAIFEATGVRPKIYRPPYGATNDMIKEISREMGMSIINWSVDSEDWKSKDADIIYNDIMRDVKSGSIILCHDLFSTTADAMERVIPALIEEGYQLVTVTELLGELEPGKVYRYK